MVTALTSGTEPASQSCCRRSSPDRSCLHLLFPLSEGQGERPPAPANGGVPSLARFSSNNEQAVAEAVSTDRTTEASR